MGCGRPVSGGKVPCQQALGGSFGAAVPAPVVVGAVRIVPAVFFVVFLVVGIEIVQCKAVMAGKEIHTGITGVSLIKTGNCLNFSNL